MDIILNLCVIFFIVMLFIFLKYTINPYLYVGIIVFSLIGLLICTSTPLYYTTGINTTMIYEESILMNVITKDIQQDFHSFNYILELFYLMAFIGSVTFWTMENKKVKNEY